MNTLNQPRKSRHDFPAKLGTKENQSDLFIGRTREIKILTELLSDISTPSSITYIIGIPGIGKSALLENFAGICQHLSYTVSMVDGNSQDNIQSILMKIASDLRVASPLKAFDRKMREYQALIKRIQENGSIPPQILETIGLGMGINFSYPINSLIPLDPISLQTTIKTLYSNLSLSEIEFLLQPNLELTTALVNDMNSLASNRKTIVLVDTYEKIQKINDWFLNNFTSRLSSNVVIVVACRSQPFLSSLILKQEDRVKIISLEQLTPKESAEYFKKRGIVNDNLVQNLISFTKGYPLALSIGSVLVKRMELEQLGDNSQQYEIAKILTSLLTDGVKDVTLKTAIECCAILKWFNQPILRYMLPPETADTIFDTISHLPFIRYQADGFSFHELIRYFIQEELAWRDPEKYRQLHCKAAEYFSHLATPEQGSWWKTNRLKIYHLIRGDEERGIALLETMISRYLQFRFFSRLEVCDDLLSEAADYNFADATLSTRFTLLLAEVSLNKSDFKVAYDYYLRISESDVQDSNIRIRIEFGYGEVLFRQHQTQTARFHFERCKELLEKTYQVETTKYAQVLHSIADTYRVEGKFELSLANYKSSLELANQLENWYAVGDTLHMITTLYKTVMNDYSNALIYIDQAIMVTEKINNESALGYLYLQRGHLNCLSNKLEIAYKDIQIGFNLVKKYNVSILLGWAHYTLGYYFMKVNDFTEAEKNLTHSYQIFCGCNFSLYQAVALLSLCEFYKLKRDYDSFDSNIRSLLDISKDYPYHDILAQAYLLKAHVSLDLNQLDIAVMDLTQAFEHSYKFNQHYTEVCWKETIAATQDLYLLNPTKLDDWLMMLNQSLMDAGIGNTLRLSEAGNITRN